MLNDRENEISQEDVIFSKELPGEVEFYRTSTERDLFVRPTNQADDEDSVIEDNGDDGVDVDELEIRAGFVTYNYYLQMPSTDQENATTIQIQATGPPIANEATVNKTFEDFTKRIIEENINDPKVIENLFKSAIANAVNTATPSSTTEQLRVNETVSEPDTRSVTPSSADSMQPETVQLPDNELQNIESPTTPINSESTSDENDDDVTEQYQSRILKRPRLKHHIDAIIRAYKLLNNFPFFELN